MSLGGDGRAQATDRLPVDAHRPPHQPARGSGQPPTAWRRLPVPRTRLAAAHR